MPCPISQRYSWFVCILGGLVLLSFATAKAQSISAPDCRGLSGIAHLENQRVLSISRLQNQQDILFSYYVTSIYRDTLFVETALPDPLFGTLPTPGTQPILHLHDNPETTITPAFYYSSNIDFTVRECTFAFDAPQLSFSYSRSIQDDTSILGLHGFLGNNAQTIHLDAKTTSKSSGLSLGLGVHALFDLNPHFAFIIVNASNDAHELNNAEESSKDTNITHPGSWIFSGKGGIGTTIPVNTLLISPSFNIAFHQASLADSSYVLKNDNVDHTIHQDASMGSWVNPSFSVNLQQYFADFDASRIGFNVNVHGGYTINVGESTWKYNVDFAQQTINLDNNRFDVSIATALVGEISADTSLELYAKISRVFNNADFSFSTFHVGTSIEMRF